MSHVAKDDFSQRRFSDGALILKIKFDDLHTLFNAITFHGDYGHTLLNNLQKI